MAAFLLLNLQATRTAERPASQSEPADVFLITEFQFDPPGLDKDREWIELANLGEEAIELAGYGLGDEELPGAGEGMVRFPAGGVIEAGKVVVVTQTAVGFRALFGTNPDFEITDSDSAVPDMIVDTAWASGRVALANDGDEILLIDDQDNLLDSVNYGDRTTYFTPSIPAAIAGQSIERLPAFCDTNSAVDWQPQPFPTPGEVQLKGTCNPAPEPAETDSAAYRPIGEIQGTQDTSPLINQIVTFRGVVTGVRENQNASGVIFYTLFVQDIPGFEDANSATSDGIAVFLGRRPPEYRPGDIVSITGQVTEYFGLTEIDDTGLSIESYGSSGTLPAPVPIEMPPEPAASAVYLEKLEGMLVMTNEILPVVGPTHSGCGFALGPTSTAKRPIRHTEQETIAPQILVLSHSDVDCSDLPSVKSGDHVSGVAGPLTFDFDQYKIVQQSNEQLSVELAPLSVTAGLSVPDAGMIRIATMNLDNFLSPDPGSSSEIYETKKRKLAYTIGQSLGCPELIGVQEVDTEQLLQDLARQAAAGCGFTYDVTHLESADGRGIDVALLSDPRRIQIRSARLHQTCSAIPTGVNDENANCPEEEEPLFSRPPLEVNLQVVGEPLTVIVNHFKSKRGGEKETAPRRLAQAAHVNDLVRARLAGDPLAAIIVLGDFNDYGRSEAWQKMREGDVLIDAMQYVPVQERYSYIFDGISQLVDGILVSPALAHRIEKVAIAHVNADYPITFAFDDKQPALPYHASDHDPVLLTLSPRSHSKGADEAAAPTAAPQERPTATSPSAATPTAALQPTAQSVDVAVPQAERGGMSRLFLAGVGLMIAALAAVLLARRILS